MIKAEQETTVTFTAADSHVSIYTCHAATLRALLARPGVTVEEQGEYADGTAWASLLVPVERFNLASAIKRELTDAERAARAQNLPGAREES